MTIYEALYQFAIDRVGDKANFACLEFPTSGVTAIYGSNNPYKHKQFDAIHCWGLRLLLNIVTFTPSELQSVDRLQLIDAADVPQFVRDMVEQHMPSVDVVYIHDACPPQCNPREVVVVIPRSFYNELMGIEEPEPNEDPEPIAEPEPIIAPEPTATRHDEDAQGKKDDFFEAYARNCREGGDIVVSRSPWSGKNEQEKTVGDVMGMYQIGLLVIAFVFCAYVWSMIHFELILDFTAMCVSLGSAIGVWSVFMLWFAHRVKQVKLSIQ